MTEPTTVTTPSSERERALDRPPPRIASLAGAAAGLLLLFSLTLFLSEIGGDNQRIGGVLVALVFEALGVGLLLLDRDGRAATAGVTLTALGVIPLLVYLFVDVREPGKTISDVGSFTSTATLILLVAAGLWLAAYLIGPGKRYGFYLGAALLAIWLVAVVQIVDSPLSQVFGRAQTFTSIGPATPDFSDPGFSDPGFDDPGFQDPSFQDPGFDDFEGSSTSESPENPSTKLGIVSLLFGGAYLAAAGWRDRRNDRRQGTVFVAVSLPILTLAVLFLGDPLDATGSALLAIALGGAAIWLGSAAGRRFTSWYGTLAAVIATTVLVDQAVGESARVSGAVLLILGLGVAVVAMRIWEPPAPTATPAATPAAVPPWTGPPGSTPWTGPPGATPWGSNPPSSPTPEPSSAPPTSAPPTPPDASATPDRPDVSGRSPWDRPEPH